MVVGGLICTVRLECFLWIEFFYHEISEAQVMLKYTRLYLVVAKHERLFSFHDNI